MKDKKFEKLVKKALETPPILQQIREITAEEAFKVQRGSRISCINHFKPGAEVVFIDLKKQFGTDFKG